MSASQLRARRNRLLRSSTADWKTTSHSHILGTSEQTTLLDHARPFYTSASQSRHQRSATRFTPKNLFSTIWRVLQNSYINVLLVFVPVGIIGGVLEWPAMARFVLNFAGIVPLAALISFATEELAATMGPAIGGLLNATFGNAIELIVCIISLTKGEYRLIQTSILGSVLVNILLVLGSCFVAGGIQRRESKYDPTVASIMSALQTLAASALLVPAILYATLLNSSAGDTIEILDVSRATSIVLMTLYFIYLAFQLKTHSGLFSDDVGGDDDDDEDDSQHDQLPNGNERNEAQKDVQKEGDILGPWGALTCLVLSTVCVGFNVEFLVDSINEVVESTPLTKTFVGIIILPLVSNAAEHVTAVIVSWKGKMNLALLVDLGSGLQISLFVTPLLVIIAWILDKPLSLHFQLFETVVFFLSVLVVNFLIRGGTSNYLEGCLCIGWYIIIAIAFFYYKEPDDLYGS